jgi:cell division transport system ATP-binding protein
MIRFDHVSQIYRGNKRPALNSVDLEILRGEFVFLVGASGSGKSSFLRLVLKEDKPTHGSIHVLGQDLGAISSRKIPYFRRNLGVVFQDFRLLPNKNVFDNVAFTLQVIGKSRGFIQEAVPDVLAMVGLSEKANRLPHELSGGEQQRVAIARAVVNKPAILLADEPTGNLDPLTSGDIMRVLQRINAGGTTVIMATHDNAIVDQMQRRVIELIQGEIVRDELQGGYGMTAEIAQRDVAMTSEIGIPGMAGGRRQSIVTAPAIPTFSVPQPVQPAPVHLVQSTSVQEALIQQASMADPILPPLAPAAPTASTAASAAGPLLPAIPPASVVPAAPEAVPIAAQSHSRFAPPSSSVQPAPAERGGEATPGHGLAAGPVPGTAEPLDAVTDQLSLAERLGLRAPGERIDPAASQEVGPTT